MCGIGRGVEGECEGRGWKKGNWGWVETREEESARWGGGGREGVERKGEKNMTQAKLIRGFKSRSMPSRPG